VIIVNSFLKYLKQKPMRVVVKRKSFTDKQITGVLEAIEGNNVIYTCYTLELPDKNNEKQKSCIPRGQYEVVKRNSPKYGDHFHILDVPDRSMILIHSGNYYTHTLGCILVGKGLSDINGDGLCDTTQSKVAMTDLNRILPKQFNITII